MLVENETNLAALAELREGAARDREDFVLLWLGQGWAPPWSSTDDCAGGLGRRGRDRLPAGARRHRPPSATGCDGGFHELACTAAVEALAREHGLAPGRARLRPRTLPGRLARRLAVGAAAVASVLDPGCVVLGGETGHSGGADLAARVEAELAALSPLRTEVRATALGDAAVLRGALLTARDAAQEDLFP